MFFIATIAGLVAAQLWGKVVEQCAIENLLNWSWLSSTMQL
jgi:hypothetical protein